MIKLMEFTKDWGPVITWILIALGWLVSFCIKRSSEKHSDKSLLKQEISFSLKEIIRNCSNITTKTSPDEATSLEYLILDNLNILEELLNKIQGKTADTEFNTVKSRIDSKYISLKQKISSSDYFLSTENRERMDLAKISEITRQIRSIIDEI